MLSSFASLPARPPTPPRDVSKDVDAAVRFLREGHEETASESSPAQLRHTTNTPPPGSPASSLLRSSINTKKVDFSPFPTYHKIPQPGQATPNARNLKQTPIRRENRPLKSILKPATEPLPPTPDDLESKLSYFSPQEPGSFRKMLQSVLNQLGSSSRDDRLDAYLALTGSLKMYEGLPEPEAIVEKIGLFQQFICRDIQWRDADGQLDTNIVQQALTLAGMLLFNPHVGPAFDNDFRVFLIDRSTAVIEQCDASKAIVKNHMYLMAQQRFSSMTMTAPRADRLINAMQGIEDRCSGNSLISARLVVFQRLLESQPNTMLHRMRDWIEHILHGMLSSIDDIRIRAIETCTHAGLRLGTQLAAVRIIFEVMDRTEENSEDGQSYGDYFNFQLMKMAGEKDKAPFVPQIWGAIVLFFRCKRKPVEKWPKIKGWLLTIQKSLNSGDLEVKHQASIAWNRLVFSVMPDAATAEGMRSMLRVPIAVALEKRGNDRFSQQSKQIAMDSYCNLLHYGLRPSLTHEELDTAWDLYVDPVLSKMVQSKGKGPTNVCRILHGLLVKSSGIWNPNAAIESGAIKPEDLPRLDPRWVRTRLSKVIRILEPLLIAGMWTMPDSNRAPDDCWRFLMQALAEAGSQEVKTSNELKEAMAQITNLFRRLWYTQAPPRSEAESSVWMHRYQSLLEQAVECLGSSHFVEDILARTETDEIEAAPTPSHRHSKHPPTAYPAFVFLFALYYQPDGEINSSGLYKKSASWFLQLLGNSKPSTSSNLGLLHRALQFAPDAQTDDKVSSQVWNTVADSASEAMTVSSPASARDAQIMGIALNSAINILVHGLGYTSFPDCKSKITELYATICQSAKHYGHEGGVALGVMEPISKLLNPKLDDIPLPALVLIAKAVFENGAWPKNRQELDQSRKALWAISLELRKTPVFDPFEHIYSFFVGIMDRAYRSAADSEAVPLKALPGLMKEAVQFLRRCPASTLPAALRQLQNGFAIWAEDRQRCIFPLSGSSMPNRVDGSAIIGMWSDLLQLVEGVHRKDSSLLQALEPLLIAGLSSPSKEIVNSTISFWNATFGEEDSLEYPSRIVPVLRARKAETELSLPGLADDDNAEVAKLPAFAESQLGLRTVSDFAFSSSPRVSSDIRKKAPADNFFVKQHLASQGLPYDSRPRSSKKKPSSGKATKAKLRHDDSQIDFAPIESSSPQGTPEESQLLTERQREVKTRQQGDAQMFPGLSSSPNAHSTSRRERIAKKLNFTPDVARDNEGDMVTETPPAPADGNPMSDDLPSSPTPRATTGAKANNGVENYSDDEDDNETIVDPPSSPPRRDASPRIEREVGPDETTVVESTAIGGQGDDTDAQDDVQPEENEDGQGEDEIDEVVPGQVASDLPSDSLLPAEQLAREAAAAAAATPIGRTDTVADSLDKAVEQEAATTDDARQENGDESPSRIQDSILQPNEDEDDATPTASQEATPKSTRSSRKRKRAEASEAASQSKRNKPSPFKRFFSTLVGSQQEAQEEEFSDDEIVVASSRVRSSPLPKREPVEEPSAILNSQVPPAVPEKRKPGRPKKTSTGPPRKTPVEPAQETPAEVPRKRKPGRPRKSESQLSSQSDVSEVNGSKRRASVMSTENRSSVSVVKDTPAPTKARKSARFSQDTDAGSSSRVVATPAHDDGEDELQGEQPEFEEEEQLSAEQQLTAEHSAVLAGRRIAQPKSILDRLRGVLGDCKKMVFGSVEEERQFDDVLFEIRREVHEAGRRARE